MSPLPMSLSLVRRQYVTLNESSTGMAKKTYVQGPAEFVKLALDTLHLPYIYLKPNLKLQAGRGASFQVHHFGVNYANLDRGVLARIENKSGGKLGTWVVAKQLAPPDSLWREAISSDGAGADRLRLAAMVREMRILAHEPLRSHGNIVSVFGFSWDKDADEFGCRWPVLIMESAGCGSLSDFIRLTDSVILNPELTLSLAIDIAAGLEALHLCDIVHGDVKTDNILIFEVTDGGVSAKLSDFGSSIIMPDIKSAQPTTVTLLGYSPPWDAPEASGSIAFENLPMVDVYSFGLAACQLALGQVDFWARFRIHDNLGPKYAQYDAAGINILKEEPMGMIKYAKSLLPATLPGAQSRIASFHSIVDVTLHELPCKRRSMSGILLLLRSEQRSSDKRTDGTPISIPIPPLPEDDIDADEHPQYQDFSTWNRDLMLSASTDIVSNWSRRCETQIASSDPDEVSCGAQMLFWLSRSALSGSLAYCSQDRALEWMLMAARAGSAEAKASVYNVLRALSMPLPLEEVGTWLSDAFYCGEDIAEWGLKEEFPDNYPTILHQMRTTFCGYGQDCFGERWRTEYPIDYLDEIVDDYIEEGRDINDLHNADGLACGMTWLHYAASNGRVDSVRYLLQKGADPNIMNDYGETPLFMACQGGHFEVASLLCPLTQRPSDLAGHFAKNELHHLGRFEPHRMSQIADILVQWGAHLNQQENDRHQTPLAYLLNQHGPNSESAAYALLRLGADPLVKDYHGLECLAHAACQLSSTLVNLVAKSVPVDRIVHSLADALWFTLELDRYDILVNGGANYLEKLESTLQALVSPETCQQFQEKTQSHVFSFACAKSALEVVKIIHSLLSGISQDANIPSAQDLAGPLTAAVVRSRVEVVTYLLELGADPSLRQTPEASWNPLFYAVSGPPEIVRSLIEKVRENHGWDAARSFVGARDENGATAFDVAVSGEFFASADVLVPYNPPYMDFVFQYEPGSTCFYNTLGLVPYIKSQVLYLLRIMDSQTVAPEVDNDGATILHAVCGVPIDRAPEEDAQAIVDAVTTKYPQPDNASRRTGRGETPLHFAARFGNVYAIRRLERIYGAAIDWDATRDDGWTALDEALSREHQDVSDLGMFSRTVFRRRTEETVTLLRRRAEVAGPTG